MTGNVTAAGVAQKLRINPSDLSVNITGLNDPIDNDVKLAFVVEDPTNRGPQATPGTITLKGKADLFDQDKFALAKAQVDEKLNLADVNLAALNPFLAIAKVELELGGVAAGAVDVGLKGRVDGGGDGGDQGRELPGDGAGAEERRVPVEPDGADQGGSHGRCEQRGGAEGRGPAGADGLRVRRGQRGRDAGIS